MPSVWFQARPGWLAPVGRITAYDRATGLGGWTEVDYLRVVDGTGRLLHTVGGYDLQS